MGYNYQIVGNLPELRCVEAKYNFYRWINRQNIVDYARLFSFPKNLPVTSNILTSFSQN